MLELRKYLRDGKTMYKIYLKYLHECVDQQNAYDQRRWSSWHCIYILVRISVMLAAN